MYEGQHLMMGTGLGVALVVMIFIVLAIGALAGWLAGKLTEGHGFGFWRNAGLGILGAFVGSLLFGLLGIYTFGVIAGIVKATVGAVVVLAIAHWLRHRRAA
jgi:uncharacterized membrane protein YeaQ/YmgE (transglycosylase-associated protein family)